MNPKLSHITVKSNATIKKLISAMESNKPAKTGIPSGLALVVDNKGRLEGIVTDGDLRRALANGITLNDSVERVMNKKPLLITGRQGASAILSIISDRNRREHQDAAHFEKVILVDNNRQPIEVLSLYDLWKSSDVRFKRIGVVGLGYVGLTLALTFADLGFSVNGVDISPAVVKSLRTGTPHFFEQGLSKLLKDHIGKRFNVVDNFDGENACDVYFITVGTPIGKDGLPSLDFIRTASDFVGRQLKRGDLVVFRSTVPMGTTRNTAVPILEKRSGLTAGDGFLLAFAPERTIEGKALEELRHLPQVVGGFNHASAELTSNIFSFMTKSIVLVDSLEEAEMVKLVNNTYRAVTFTFANELSLIAKRWGLDTRRVIHAANFGYERSKVPLPSPGVGGYCLEKDPAIFLHSAKTKGYEPILFKHTTTLSNRMLDHIADEILVFLKKGKIKPEKAHVSILGFAFKGTPATSDVRGSTTYGLIERLKARKVKHIHGYDPYVRKSDIDPVAAYLLRPDEAIKKSHVVVVMNNNPHFAELDMRSYLEVMSRPVFLVDTWGLYDTEDIGKLAHVTHYRL
jgi:nucleotide sugar dehydrogenase